MEDSDPGARKARRPPVWLLAAALGPLYAWIFRWATEAQPWTRSLPLLDFFDEYPRAVALAFALACLATARILRGWIAQASLLGTIPCTCVASLLGAGFFLMVLMLIEVLAGPQEVGISGLLTVVVVAPLLGALGSYLYAPVALPLVWLSILLLRGLEGHLRTDLAERLGSPRT